jgi:hypothetical protein
MSDFNFADLQNNFERRTYYYTSDRDKLARSNPRLLNWIGSIDYSGFTREKCLKYLLAHYQLGDENRILLRLEDWVTKIRDIAFNWTQENFNKLSLEQIQNNHRLILYLAKKQRLKDSEAIQIINTCLIEKITDLESSKFFALNTNLRKYIYFLELTESQYFRSLVVRDRDPNNRLLLLKFFKFEQLTATEIATLQQDKCSLVKKRFIYYRLEQNIPIAKQELITLALDRNKSIREIAAYYLKRDYEVDAYQIYKQRTDLKFYYIADYALQEDLTYFEQGLQIQNKQIKLLCLKAICHIDANYLKQFDLQQLILENNKFRQLIIKYVGTTLSLSELQKYRDILSRSSQGELIYLNLLAKNSYWHFVDRALDLLLNNLTQANLNCIWKIHFAKSTFYQKIDTDLKSTIMIKLDLLKKTHNNQVQKLCQEFEFILQYV